MSIDWDAWRAAYPTTGYAEQVAFYESVWERHPQQVHFDLPRARAFLEHVRPRPGEHVFEVGGWRGELAAAVRDLLPEGVTWENVEITRGAVAHPVPEGGWYAARVPDCWVWEEGEHRGELLIASHVIEHMAEPQLRALLGTLPGLRAAFVQSPLPEQGRPDWRGYEGTHVLDASWPDVELLFAGAGLRRVPGMDGLDSRSFVR